LTASLYLLSERFKRIIRDSDVAYISKWTWPIPLIKKLGKPVVLHVHEYSLVCPIATLYDFSVNEICQGCRFPHSFKCILAHESTKKRSWAGKQISALLNIFLGRQYGRLAHEADALIFVSHAQRDTILRHMASLDTPSYVIYNPLPKVEYPVPTKKGYGFFGGTSTLKGFRLLLRVLTATKVSVKVHILGCTSYGSIPTYITRLEEKLVVHGKVPYYEINSIYQFFTTVLFPSIGPEPAPYVVLESLSRGRLLIASNVGGIKELVGGSPGVFLFPPGNATALADEIRRVDSMPKTDLMELGLRNKEFVDRKYNNHRSFKQLTDVLEKLH
jgi:glycosyltransferase involved in cell wall biosynthesis